MSAKWGLRFFQASLIHGIIAAVWTGLWIIPGLNLTRIVAAGWPGTFHFVAYFAYLCIGFLSMAVFGAAYHLIPQIAKKPLYSEKLALTHFVLINLGVVASWLLAIVGTTGGTLLMAKAKTEEIHIAIVGFSEPIAIFLTIGVLGVLVGILNLILTSRK